jgi:serine/threonine protein kinase
MTAAGLILGTAAYMSPEQAKAREADKRSDVWSFGAMLYEMLTGRRAFAGEDVSDTLASVLKSEPDWSIVPDDVPPAVVSLMKGCLVKDRRQRVSDISTAKFVLKDLSAMGVVGSAGVPEAPLAGRSRLDRASMTTIPNANTDRSSMKGKQKATSRIAAARGVAENRIKSSGSPERQPGSSQGATHQDKEPTTRAWQGLVHQTMLRPAIASGAV